MFPGKLICDVLVYTLLNVQQQKRYLNNNANSQYPVI